MPRFTVVFLLSLLSVFLAACAGEPDWVAPAENYSALAEEVARDTLADADFALDALRDTTKYNISRLDEAKSRAEIARSRQESYEAELNDARRAINAPAGVVEMARALSGAVSQVHYDALGNMDSTIAWGEFLASAQGAKADLKSWADRQASANGESVSQFEAALADFNAAIEQAKQGNQ